MCYFSSGMLSDFLGRLSGEPVAVMEVECRSRNDERCRFLSASPDTLNVVYEQMTQGTSYEQALGDRKSTRLNSSHGYISYAVFCLKKKMMLSDLTQLCHPEARAL